MSLQLPFLMTFLMTHPLPSISPVAHAACCSPLTACVHMPELHEEYLAFGGHLCWLLCSKTLIFGEVHAYTRAYIVTQVLRFCFSNSCIGIRESTKLQISCRRRSLNLAAAACREVALVEGARAESRCFHLEGLIWPRVSNQRLTASQHQLLPRSLGEPAAK